MPSFLFKAKNQSGQIIQDSIIARNKGDAKKRIKQMQYKLISVAIDKSNVNSDDPSSQDTPIVGEFIYKDANGNIQISLGNDQPTAKHLIVFTKQFATMISSGVPMIQSLSILSRQQESKAFSRALFDIKNTIENGSSLSNSLRLYPHIFDNLYVAMCEAGEASGKLDEILVKLVEYIEKSEKIKSQVKSAMVYPIVVVFVAIAVISFLLAFVVPTFAQQFSDSGRELPGLTQIVINASEWFGSNWYLVFGGIVAFVFGFRYWLKTDKGREIFDRNILKAPGIGNLLRKVAVGRFCSTMSSMLTSGVNLLEALSICAASSGNRTVETFISSVREGLERGERFSDPLARGTLFPPMVVSMVEVGESTGALDDMLMKVSEFYEEEVELAVAAMLSMIEPILIVFIGGMVAFILIAMYLPIFDLAGGIT